MYYAGMDEGRKRVLAIVAGILVARHLKTTDDLFDSRSSPRTESLVAAAVQWAERIMRKIDNVFPKSEGPRRQTTFWMLAPFRGSLETLQLRSPSRSSAKE